MIQQLFSRRERTVREWKSKWKGKVREKDGKFWGPDVVRWFEEEFCGRGSSTKKLDELLKVQKLKSEQLDYEIKLGKYYLKEDVEREWQAMVSEFKQSLLALEAKLSDQLADKAGRPIPAVRQILRQEVYMMLGNIVREGKYRPAVRDELPIELQEQALDEFWQKMKALPIRKYKRIKVDVKGRMR